MTIAQSNPTCNRNYHAPNSHNWEKTSIINPITVKSIKITTTHKGTTMKTVWGIHKTNGTSKLSIFSYKTECLTVWKMKGMCLGIGKVWFRIQIWERQYKTGTNRVGSFRKRLNTKYQSRQFVRIYHKTVHWIRLKIVWRRKRKHKEKTGFRNIRKRHNRNRWDNHLNRIGKAYKSAI